MASNISPQVWGSAGWVFLRNIAKGYPDKPTPMDKEKYKNYFELIGDVLPCSKCRKNYKTHWKQIPITNYLANKNQLYKWVNIIKSKSKPDVRTTIKNRLISERILRIKGNRKSRASNNKKCGACG